MRTAEAIVAAYNARAKSKNWAEWAKENWAHNAILRDAEKLADE